MDVIILCGGIGSRIKSISGGVPKALMPVGNVLFLDILLERLIKFSNNIYFSLCYRPELFLKYIKSSRYSNLIIPVIEKEPLGTGGAILNVINNSDIASNFLVVNGDSLSDINLIEMKKYFSNTSWEGVVGVSRVDDVRRYGSINHKNGKILSFIEKSCSRGAGWINNGYYIFNKNILLGNSGTFSLEKDILPRLVKENKLGGFLVKEDKFIDMGVPEDYKHLCIRFKD